MECGTSPTSFKDSTMVGRNESWSAEFLEIPLSPNDARPITVASLLWRLWSSIIARSVLQY